MFDTNNLDALLLENGISQLTFDISIGIAKWFWTYIFTHNSIHFEAISKDLHEIIYDHIWIIKTYRHDDNFKFLANLSLSIDNVPEPVRGQLHSVINLFIQSQVGWSLRNLPI